MKSMWTQASVLAILLAGPGWSTTQARDEPKKEMAVDAFKLAIKEARSFEEKADLIRLLGGAETVDSAAVAEIARFLAFNPGDLNFQLPLASISALAALRGNSAASQILIQAIPPYRKTPFILKKLIASLGQVGHESGVPVLEDLIKGSDGDLAILAAGALADLPADLALDSLFRMNDWMISRRPKVGEDAKKLYDRVGLELLKIVQQISAQKYPTMTEMRLWWQKHGREWKDIASVREQGRRRQRPGPPAETAPDPIVELRFNERVGTTTANLGSSSGLFPLAGLTKNRPVWSGEVPPPGTGSSLDWGIDPGPYAVDIAGPMEHLKNLRSFTVSGWINARSATEGAGGNRIMSWLDRDGVEIVHRSDGSLQVGLNQKAEASELRTPAALVPLVDLKVDHALLYNWRFLAVTFDSTASSGHLKIYWGTRDLDASLVFQADSSSGRVGPRVAASLSIGNIPSGVRPINPRCNFRGLIDEVRIFGSTRDGAGALSLPAIIKVQGRT